MGCGVTGFLTLVNYASDCIGLALFIKPSWPNLGDGSAFLVFRYRDNSHHYFSGSITPPTASDLVEEKVQTKGMDMGEVLQKTHEYPRRVSSSPSLTAHLGGRLTVNWQWRLIGLL